MARRRLTWLTAGVRRRSVPPPGVGWVRAGLGVGSGGQLDGALGTSPVSFLEEPLGGVSGRSFEDDSRSSGRSVAGWALPRGQFSRSPAGRGPWRPGRRGRPGPVGCGGWAALRGGGPSWLRCPGAAWLDQVPLAAVAASVMAALTCEVRMHVCSSGPLQVPCS